MTKRSARELLDMFKNDYVNALHALTEDDVAEWNRDLLAKLQTLQPGWYKANGGFWAQWLKKHGDEQ